MYRADTPNRIDGSFLHYVCGCRGVRSTTFARALFAGGNYLSKQRKTVAGRGSAFRWGHRARRARLQALLGSAHCSAQRRTKRTVDHDGRCGFRRIQYVRRSHPHARAGPHRQQRPALHQFQLHSALLAHPCCSHYRTEPPLGRVWRHLRTSQPATLDTTA